MGNHNRKMKASKAYLASFLAKFLLKMFYSSRNILSMPRIKGLKRRYFRFTLFLFLAVFLSFVPFFSHIENTAPIRILSGRNFVISSIGFLLFFFFIDTCTHKHIQMQTHTRTYIQLISSETYR